MAGCDKRTCGAPCEGCSVEEMGEPCWVDGGTCDVRCSFCIDMDEEVK